MILINNIVINWEGYMYVCICEGITEKQIKSAIDSGCSSVRDLRKELRVARDCGLCLEEVFEMIKASREFETPFIDAANVVAA